MSSPHPSGPDLSPSPWFNANRTRARAAPTAPVEAATPIYARMVAEFGDPFSVLGPTRARWPRHADEPPATA